MRVGYGRLDVTPGREWSRVPAQATHVSLSQLKGSQWLTTTELVSDPVLGS